MVETGQDPIRLVHYLPPGPAVGDIEVNTLAGIRDRGGPHEFLTLQRLDFDLVVHIESGTARHTVDFTDHPLGPGDVLWVRAGQVHRWGAIEDIEGAVVMFGPHTVDDHTGRLIRHHTVRPRTHWPATDLEHSRPPGPGRPARGQRWCERTTMAHVCARPPLPALPGSPPAPAGTPRAVRKRAPPARPTRPSDGSANTSRITSTSWHKVSDYADRLGYSSRTLNRLARQNTGLSAKELIDERVVLEAKGSSATGTAPSPRSPSARLRGRVQLLLLLPPPHPHDAGHLPDPQPLRRGHIAGAVGARGLPRRCACGDVTCPAVLHTMNDLVSRLPVGSDGGWSAGSGVAAGELSGRY